jgi:uncharacterized protein
MADVETIALFPLATTLFPGGVLPLKIFELRYLDMVKKCIAQNLGFGVVSTLPQAGESGATYSNVGTLATITHWDMPHVGIFTLNTCGAIRFAIEARWVEKDGLNVGRVRLIPNEPDAVFPLEFEPLARLLAALIENVGADKFPSPLQLDSASWVSMRLAEVIPLSLKIKQQLLEINDPVLRLRAIETFLARNNVTKK